MNLVKKIQENIFRYELFRRGASAKGGSQPKADQPLAGAEKYGGKIVVGVSGGPDSVCLLHVLHELQKKYDLELIIAHVNYGLRGKDSEKDEQLVKKLADKYSFPFEILKVEKAGKSEDRLRAIRYDFFEKVSRKYKADAITVGHNLNDQAETVLMRIIRGTGLRGIGAIKFRNQNIIRPLLNVPRKEILAYLRKNKIAYRIDKTNLGTDFTRNKIRNLLIPDIEKSFNPNIQESLYKFSESATADYDFIAWYAREWLSTNKNLKASALNSLHPSIRREVLRQTIEKHNPSLREIESAHIEEILKILKSNKNKRQQITLKGLKIGRIGDKLTISRIM
ncbi:MAG: tRNA lysidine(34) synthetase TilS [Candidatus Moranbacteria bacterium]|nr:tRNA lysidine(34) synthetase TilS [Candidatus Moranbacteria bacterium]